MPSDLFEGFLPCYNIKPTSLVIKDPSIALRLIQKKKKGGISDYHFRYYLKIFIFLMENRSWGDSSSVKYCHEVLGLSLKTYTKIQA